MLWEAIENRIKRISGRFVRTPASVGASQRMSEEKKRQKCICIHANPFGSQRWNNKEIEIQENAKRQGAQQWWSTTQRGLNVDTLTQNALCEHTGCQRLGGHVRPEICCSGMLQHLLYIKNLEHAFEWRTKLARFQIQKADGCECSVLCEESIQLSESFFWSLKNGQSQGRGHTGSLSYITPTSHQQSVCQELSSTELLTMILALFQLLKNKSLNPINPPVPLIKWGLQFHYAVITLCSLRNPLILSK